MIVKLLDVRLGHCCSTVVIQAFFEDLAQWKGEVQDLPATPGTFEEGVVASLGHSIHNTQHSVTKHNVHNR